MSEGASLTLLVAAEESAGIQLLRLLANSPHRVAKVLSGPHRGGGGSSVSDAAHQLGLTVEPALRVKEPSLGDEMREAEIDVLLNVHSLHVVNPDVVEAPLIGSFNLHPGPLPQYAGLNAPSWAIYRGERRYGVTLHWMDAGIDTGPIAYESVFEIAALDTGLSLSAKCVRYGLPLIERLLADGAASPSSIPRLSQSPAERVYFGPEAPQDGWIEWDRPAGEIVDFVRACDYGPFRSPWGVPQTRCGTTQIGIAKVERTFAKCAEPPGTVGEATADGVLVAALGEWVSVRRAVVAGEPVDPASALRAGGRLESRAGRRGHLPAP